MRRHRRSSASPDSTATAAPYWRSPGRGAGTDHKGHGRRRHLGVREIEDVRGLHVQSLGTNVPCNADDVPLVPVRRKLCPTASLLGKYRVTTDWETTATDTIGGIRIGNRTSVHDKGCAGFRNSRVAHSESTRSDRDQARRFVPKAPSGWRIERQRRWETDRTHGFGARHLTQFASRRLKVVVLGSAVP